MGNIKKFAYCIGIVSRKNTQWNAARVKVPNMQLDNYLLMYFNKSTNFWAADPENKTKQGDMLLLRKTRSQKNPRIEYEIAKIIYPLGEITDPVTGKRCKSTEFINEDLRRLDPIKLSDERPIVNDTEEESK